MSFVDDLITILEEANVGTRAVSIFVGAKASLPDGPGPFITIIQTGGAPPVGTHNMTTLPAYVRPSAQIMARGEDAEAVENMAQAAYNALFPIRNRFVNGTWYVQITMKQSLMDLGEDDPARSRIAFNIDVEKRLSPLTS